MERGKFCLLILSFYQQILDSLVVRISACHVEGPGSIPGRGVLFSVPNTTSYRQRGEGANLKEHEIQQDQAES